MGGHSLGSQRAWAAITCSDPTIITLVRTRPTSPAAAYACKLGAWVDLCAAGGLRGRLAELDAVPGRAGPAGVDSGSPWSWVSRIAAAALMNASGI